MIAQEQLIGSRFEKCVVEKLIGRGGYGLTFLAFDEELQEHRVIKVSQDFGIEEAMRRRLLKSFLEEGLILSRLKHPQIVTLRGQGDKHGHRYMILDYIQGFSIRDILDIVTRRQEELGCAWRELMDPVSATALVLSTLYPLEYAHRANVHLPDREIFGVAHRDISPGNLILGVKGNEKGRLILIDFGTAKTDLTENITVDQNLVGTVPYMGKARLQKANSHEQMAPYQNFWREFRETQHDIHALGVLYYQLLTGRLPFPGDTSPQIIVKILDPECYSQCSLEIASAHPYAAAVLRKCIVYHDFSQSLSEQPYQYPDAAAMLPDMVSVFDNLSSGNSVNEILVNLGKKLSRPDQWVPARGREHIETPLSTDSHGTSKLPSPVTRHFDLQNPIQSTRRVSLYISIFGMVASLIFAVGLWFRGHPIKMTGIVSNSRTKVESPPPSSDLEKLEGSEPPDTHKNQPSAIQPGQTPTHSNKIIPSATSTHSTLRGNSSTQKVTAPAVTTSALKAEKEGPKVVGPVIGKEGFVQIQTLVRQDDPSAFDRISSLLTANPDLPDLVLLKCQLVTKRDPASIQTRQDLLSLLGKQAEYIHPELFRESVMYLLFQTDLAIYLGQKMPRNRINMQKSGNAYLSEYGSNSVFDRKVNSIKTQMEN